jgi:hypothetical protein
MEAVDFARQMTSWIFPAKVLEAARELAFDRPEAVATQWHAFTTNLGEPASLTGLDGLVREFLNGFRLTSDYVEFVRWLFRDVGGDLSEDVWSELAETRFAGKVLFSGFPTEFPPNTVLAYCDRRVVADILEDPIRLLLHVNEGMAGTWITVRAKGRAFLQQSAYGPLPAYVESVTANACGMEPNAIETGFVLARRGINYRFRSLSLVGPLDENVDLTRGADLGRKWWSAMRKVSLPVSALGALPVTAGAFTDPQEPAIRHAAKRSHPIDAVGLTNLADNGLELVDGRFAGQPWRNLERFRNEISPFARTGSGTPMAGDGLLVDRFYGQVFDFLPTAESAVYGATDAFPWLPEEAPVNLGWLRVPYRRIPRIRVTNKAEIDAALQIARTLIQGDPLLASVSQPTTDRLLFRGQSREYHLQRDRRVRLMLYGDSDAVEPSLLPSAIRRNVDVNAVMPQWCAIIGRFWDHCISRLEAQWTGDRQELTTAFEFDARQRTATLDLQLLGLSYAQHYGLASVGLDATVDLDVAIFFALSEASRVGGVFDTYRNRPRRGHDSVIYVFCPWERFLLDFEAFEPRCFPTGRPHAQRSYFLHSGWGLNRNACARNLLMALYLAPDGDYGPMPAIETLFPGPDEDPFGTYLFELVSSKPPAQLTRFLDDFRWVLPDA